MSIFDTVRPGSLAEAKADLALWKTALRAISSNQSYTMDGYQITRANIPDVHRMVKYYENEVARLQRGGRRGARVMRFIPYDT